ncbi:MAG: hypothetical protein RSF68_04895 [Myroides sp.]
MKSQDQYTIPAEIPDSLNIFISECKRFSQVQLIFYTPVTNSKLKILTLVVAKDTNGDTLAGLHSHINMLDALTQHDTFISVNYHTVAPYFSHFHFSFLQLFLQPCFVLYADSTKRWNGLFQNFYGTDKNKSKQFFVNHSTTVIQKADHAINSFVKPLMNRQMYQAANVALNEVFAYYLELLMNVSLPKSVHQNFTATQFQLFIEKYYPQFAKTLNNILKVKTMPFQDHTEYVIGESQQHAFQKTVNRVVRAMNGGVAELNAFYRNYLDQVISESLQEETLTTEQLVSFLTGHYKLDALYVLGKTKNNNNNRYSFNLLLLSDKLNIQQHDAVVRNVSSHFKGRVQICCLIHSTYWLQKHQKQLQGFIVKYMVPENRVYLKNSLVCNDTLQLFENTTQLQNTYWQQRLNYIEPLFVAFQQRDLVYRHGHILLLKNIFQHLVLALLYQRIHYVPSMYSCRYLVHLFQSFVPDVCQKCIASEGIPEVLNMLLTPVGFLPQPETAPLPCTQQVFAKALCLCEKLYSEIQNNQLLNK